ncbi:aldo/keto reductase [Colwellia echini]|uniref:L-glyceraldehyde 3-phosphate reductase n=1 Tax=Colwellia echini TaxID=1982103 RepID=A0ABY3N174_9GAMM|nr:aldo/keto reductase [Colwellia echini]TYK67243.1 L-glyceraldehyde 3-phosphate reductase [Colwellia echini]
MIQNETNSPYIANPTRYTNMPYQRCGNSGVKLPKLSLGLWQNFGSSDSYENGRELIHTAFDHGITHFDLANNYGPTYGAAESTFGRILKQDLLPYRDELFISSKAGYDMWPGPYGDGGSRKYLVASCDQSLKRTGLDYFDVFYHHRMDSETPLEETMQALDYMVRSGRALYVGISNYRPAETKQAVQILKELGTPLLIHQPRYNMFDRWIEAGLTDVLNSEGIGSIVFSPLAQGLLTNKYLQGIPQDSRAARSEIIHLNKEHITPEKLVIVNKLNNLAKKRGQSLAQMAIAWTLHNDAVTTCLIGASKKEQILDSLQALENLTFVNSEILQINNILNN